jgi:cytoskeletal protein RodZ
VTDLGQLLSKARSERGISLQELQDLTKIRKSYLIAIEEGNYNILPGNFYARAFIKQYCEVVGLDHEEVFRLYSHAIPVTNPASTNEPVSAHRHKQINATDRSGRWASLLLMIAFPLLILGVVYYFAVNYLDPQDERILNNPPLTDETITDKEDNSGVNEVAEEENNANGADQTPEPEPEAQPAPEPEPEPSISFIENVVFDNLRIERYEIVNVEQLNLNIKAISSEVWIGIKKDAKSESEYLYQGRLKSGDLFTASYDHGVYVNIGRANAVELTVNDVAVEMGPDPNPRKFQFDLTKETLE